MNSPKLDLISVNELADRIGMSTGFVYKYLRNGTIPHLKCGSGPKSAVRIKRADAEKYIASLERR